MAKIGTSLPEVAILMTIPGIALKSTLCIIAELGDIGDLIVPMPLTRTLVLI